MVPLACGELRWPGCRRLRRAGVPASAAVREVLRQPGRGFVLATASDARVRSLTPDVWREKFLPPRAYPYAP